MPLLDLNKLLNQMAGRRYVIDYVHVAAFIGQICHVAYIRPLSTYLGHNLQGAVHQLLL
jgi:hypothetical protein